MPGSWHLLMYFLTMNLTTLGTSYKWNQRLFYKLLKCLSLCLPPLPQLTSSAFTITLWTILACVIILFCVHMLTVIYIIIIYICVSICLPALPIPLKVFLTSEGNYISETPFIAIRKLDAPSQCILSTQAPLSTSSLVHRHQSHWGIIRGSRDTCWKLLWCLRQMAEGPLIKYPQVLGKRLGKSPVYYCCSPAFHHPAKSFQVVLWWVLRAFLTPILLAAVSF